MMKKRRTDEELKEILLTVDGKGKAEKAEALKELLTREYQQGFDVGKPITSLIKQIHEYTNWNVTLVDSLTNL
jgi:hypothetical protein